MKPKNKFQRTIVEASKRLPPITETQIQWAYKNGIEHIGRRTKKGVITCTECGHSWQGEGALINSLLGCKCPQCKLQLTVKTTAKRVFKECQYFCVVTTCKGFQVLRYVMFKSTLKVGSSPKREYSEVMQRWIAPDGKHCTFAKLRQTMGTMYFDLWSFGSKLELRHENPIYNRVNPEFIYPKQRLIPELKRTGFKIKLCKERLFDQFCLLLSDSRLETLLKSKQQLLYYIFTVRNKDINKYWASIRICIRNNYQPEDALIWCDYIDLLRFFGKDLYNAKYVCPQDLKAEHDKYVRKKRKFLQKQKDEEKRQKALKDEQLFNQLKSAFFGLQFNDGNLHVRVLESLKEVIQEGDMLHHCVFTNDYHLKKDSLILSATIDDEKLETVEVSLSKLQVVQCRGLCNENTDYHDRIIELVNNNIPRIQERLTA